MKFKCTKFWGFFLIVCGLYSCNTTKFIPEGGYLLDKVKIKSDIPGYKSQELRPYLRQQPNYKMFGLYKTMFHIYNLAGRDTARGFNRFIVKIGEAPVIFDSTFVDKTSSEFKKLFINKGYLHVDVTSEALLRNKKAEVTYSIQGNEPYRIRSYTTSIAEPAIEKELFGGENGAPFQQIPIETSVDRTSKVKEGMLFDRNILNAERVRLTNILRNRGYYAFFKENFIYDADSFPNGHVVDLNLKLRPLQKITKENDSISPYRKYYYDKVYFFLDYEPVKIGGIRNYPRLDSITIDNYTFFYYTKKPSLKPKTLLDNCFIQPRSLYSQKREDYTHSSFSMLPILNNIQIQFDEKTRNDSFLLDSYIFIMPTKKQVVSFSIEGTNTAGDLGVAASVYYTHRNLFRGAETFNFRVRGAYETMNTFSNPYMDLGGEISILFPKTIPFINSSLIRMMHTSTELIASYDYQTRPEYDRTLLSGGIRYQWQGRRKPAPRHQFDLLDINYVYLPRIDTVFMNNLPPSAVYFGYTNQFIVGSGYSFYVSTFDPLQKQKDVYSFRFSLESAGNLLHTVSALAKWEKDELGFYRLLGTHFAQFVKVDLDYAQTIVIDKQNSIAWRVGGGIGIPYGNSQMLPFEKRYYSGGANSVRAWPVRELGPGSYVRDPSTTFFNQSGDIKLNFNIEYRTRFFWRLEAAAFIDAGNIWTIKEYEKQEGGVFHFDSFYKQIALGYGLGLRLDFDYFLIRFDCAEKAYNPALTGSDRWTLFHPNLKENFAWHIAVGYPF
jgi:hypothetical protein